MDGDDITLNKVFEKAEEKAILFGKEILKAR